MFTLHFKNYICIVDYHSKFSVNKKTKDLSAYSIKLACNFFRLWITKENNIRHMW